MKLIQFLDRDAILIGVSASNKRALLQHLSTIAAQHLGVDAGSVADCINERERLGSTGFGSGVAVPHGKLDGIAHVFALVARLAEPVDYKAIDGQDVDILFLLLSPRDAGAEHLKALAAVSRFVRDPSTLEKLRGARSSDAFAAVLLEADERDAA